MGCHVDHTYANYLIVAERLRQRNHDGHEGNGLLTHTEDRSEDAEKQHHKNNHDIADTELSDEGKSLQCACLGNETGDTRIHCFGTVHHPECTTDDEHEGDDASLLREALKKSRKDLPGLRNAPWYKPSGYCTEQ